MWSATLELRKYRPPYLEQFFADVAQRLPLLGTEDLLDLGCGPGNVAFGFAPYVATLTGVELETAMAEECRRRASLAGKYMRVVHSSAENAPPDLGPFDFITIGQAHWYLRQPATLARIDKWLAPGSRVLICLPSDSDIGDNVHHPPWLREFAAIRRRWDRSKLHARMRLRPEDFFHGTVFEMVDTVRTHGQLPIDLEHLVDRALGYASTSRRILGADADTMIAEIRTTLAPYFKDRPIDEPHCTAGWIFRRRGAG